MSACRRAIAQQSFLACCKRIWLFKLIGASIWRWLVQEWGCQCFDRYILQLPILPSQHWTCPRVLELFSPHQPQEGKRQSQRMPPKAKANAKETKAGPGLHGHKDNERTRKTHLWVLSFLGQFNFCWDVALGPGIGCLPTCNFPLGLASKKRPPQVRFDLLEMQVLKGESPTCGGLFHRPIQVENYSTSDHRIIGPSDQRIIGSSDHRIIG